MTTWLYDFSKFGGTDTQIEYDIADTDVIISPVSMIAVDMLMQVNSLSHGPTAIKLLSSQHDLRVEGRVLGTTGVVLGDDKAVDFGNNLVVTASGSIMGTQAAVQMSGTGSVVNEGEIRGVGGWQGLNMNVGVSGSAEVVNKGLISGSLSAVGLLGGEGSSSKVVNSGTLSAPGGYAFDGLDGADHVTNLGLIEGHVSLAGGSDRFDNRLGTLKDGTVHGGTGNDTFLLGASAETVDGGAGFDTLDIRSGAGQKVTLWDKSGTGFATGDSYLGIERILGSAKGDDFLHGNHAKTTLVGGGGQDRLYDADGNDRLEGGMGSDTLAGGAGSDDLYGGAGNDTFILQPWAGGTDEVHDWGVAAGDNDRFFVNVKSFGGGLVAGEALGTKFASRDASNEAIDGVDRFIFRESDETLWFDKDGKGGAAGLMVADLQDGAVVTASDFLLSF